MDGNNIKYIKAHAVNCVVSAKVSEEMFDFIEQFRGKAQLNSRNDAIILLIAYGLHSLGEVPEEVVEVCESRYNFSPEKMEAVR